MPERSGVSTVDTAFRTLELGDLLQIGMILALGVASVIIVERGVPPVATRLGTRARSVMLPWIPVFRLFVFLLIVMLVLPIVIKPGTESLIALVGAGAVAVGFAFKDYLTSILAGVIVLFERPYRQGDWVRFGDVYGEVKEMGMRAARVLTPDDDIVTVPHGEIWTSSVHNSNNGAPTLQCATDFYAHPDHDAARIQRLLGDAALSSPWIDVSRPVVVTVRERPWGTHYRVKAYPLSAADQFRFVTDVTVRGKSLLAQAGVRPAAATFRADASFEA